ncbi:unnamed protein product [Peniophora sp. CBMAI 1063]|nr:unnamed protein product [Peniophora sp. CBMAI 1063]
MHRPLYSGGGYRSMAHPVRRTFTESQRQSANYEGYTMDHTRPMTSAGRTRLTASDRLLDVDVSQLDRIVAAVLAFRGDAEPGPALQGLDGALNRTGWEWTDHYLSRASTVEPLIAQYQPVTSVAPSTSSGHFTPDKSRRDLAQIGPSTSRLKRKAEASVVEVVLPRSKRPAKDITYVDIESEVDTDTDGDFNDPQHAARRGGPRTCNPVTVEDRQQMAEWVYTHEEGWSDVGQDARWKGFELEHTRRTSTGWASAYKRWKNDVDSRVDELKKERKRTLKVEDSLDPNQ